MIGSDRGIPSPHISLAAAGSRIVTLDVDEISLSFNIDVETADL